MLITTNVEGVFRIELYKQPAHYVSYGKTFSDNDILYFGEDKFEAICARKSWESKTKEIFSEL